MIECVMQDEAEAARRISGQEPEAEAPSCKEDCDDSRQLSKSLSPLAYIQSHDVYSTDARSTLPTESTSQMPGTQPRPPLAPLPNEAKPPSESDRPSKRRQHDVSKIRKQDFDIYLNKVRIEYESLFETVAELHAANELLRHELGKDTTDLGSNMYKPTAAEVVFDSSKDLIPGACNTSPKNSLPGACNTGNEHIANYDVDRLKHTAEGDVQEDSHHPPSINVERPSDREGCAETLPGALIPSDENSNVSPDVDFTATSNTRGPSKQVTSSIAFPLLPHWESISPSLLQKTMTNIRSSHMRNSTGSSSSSFTPDDLSESYEGIWKKFISRPGAPKRLAWDFAGAILIMYDLVGIPLLVFDPPDSDFGNGMDWFTLVFWTANIPLSLMVGFVKDGLIIMSPRKIAVNYAKTWLIVDLIVVMPDWGFTLASIGQTKSGAADSVKLLRVLRLVRMVRLLRLLKLRKIMDNLNEMIDSEYISILANVLKMIILLLVINHYIACLWYLVGTTAGEEASWIDEFKNDQWSYQYKTAFHWSITQFTPSSMHVQPQNSTERVFAIWVVVFALVGFSYVVGSITGSLTQLRMMQENASKQLWTLRRFLKQNKVSSALQARIQRYVEHALLQQQKKMSQKDVRLCSLLSEQLLSELDCEIKLPPFSIHPLFSYIARNVRVTAQRLAKAAITNKVLARNDVMFIQGEIALNMHIVVTGELMYWLPDKLPEKVDEGEDWIAEPVLWTPRWIHLGELIAKSECDLLIVSPGDFGKVIVLNPQAASVTSTYARKFLEWLNTTEIKELSDIWQGEMQNVQDLCYKFMDLPDEMNGRMERITTMRKKSSYR